MNMEWLLGLILILLLSNAITFFLIKRNADKNLQEFDTLTRGLAQRRDELKETKVQLTDATVRLSRIDAETKELQALKSRADHLASAVESHSRNLESLKLEISTKTSELLTSKNNLDKIRSTLDLYTRIEDFVAVGHFEMPQYLYETSSRFSEEIKRVREKQRDMIKAGGAVVIPDKFAVSSDSSLNKKIMNGQMKLVLSAFNIECDFLIGKVSPSSFARTLERIEKLANNLEKTVANLHCGIDIKYIELKYEECKLQYQFTLKKKEEQEEQRLIREQIREEQKAIKEYERAVAKAEQEERMYRDMLEKAREELGRSSEEERSTAEQRIADLERRLAEAEAKEERAKSMAEQTRKGHVYVISNIGSFGKDVYKIGLTRRLDPMDRVKELGDASVPFSFDIHAMIYVEDAPTLETALHREFSDARVNAVNLRKEFFRVDLDSIRSAVGKIAGFEADFKTTIAAEEYYETKRLQGRLTSSTEAGVQSSQLAPV